MKPKKLDIKYHLLAFIETFSIWQMGIIFYSSKTLTLNNLVNTPITLNNSILIVIIGYIIGIISIYLFPKKTILLGKISMIISLLATILLFFNIPTSIFKILYYLSTFNCVFFIAINTSLIINYYSLKSALNDAIIGSIVVSFFLIICQNPLIPLSFKNFNIISTICLILIIYALFQLPKNHELKLLNNKDKVKQPPKKLFIPLILVQAIACLSTLFTSSIAESIKGGVSITYLGGLTSGIIFIILIKKLKLSPIKITTYYFAITAIGFLLYLPPTNSLKYISLFLQGFNSLIILLSPFLMSNIFEIYPSKTIAPLMTTTALITVFISSIITETFRKNPTILYSIYTIIAVIAIIIFLTIEKNLNEQYYTNQTPLDKLTEREKEVTNLLIKGYTLIEIANTLFLSKHTIKDHIKSIYKKYNVHSKIELINLIENIKRS